MRYVDLTQTFTAAMPVYPGDRPAALTQIASLEQDGTTNFEIKSSLHVGTHVDGPWHMIPGGHKLVDTPVQNFFGRGVVVDVRGQAAIGAAVLTDVSLERGDIVLLATGWADNFGQPNYYTAYPAVTEEFATNLVAAGVKMLGLDAPSPDHPPFPVHKILLKNNILIIENLTQVVGLIGETNIELVVAPLKIEADSALARVVARVGESG